MAKFRFKIYADDSLRGEYIPYTHTINVASNDIRDADPEIMRWAHENGYAVERINHSGKTISIAAPIPEEWDQQV